MFRISSFVDLGCLLFVRHRRQRGEPLARAHRHTDTTELDNMIEEYGFPLEEFDGVDEEEDDPTTHERERVTTGPRASCSRVQ